MCRPFKPILVTTIVLAFFVSFWPGKAICYGFDMGLGSLAGLEGVLIGVMKLPRDATDNGLTKKQIVHDIKTQLTKANIKVLTPQDVLLSPGSPSLLVTIGLSKLSCPSEKPSGYLYSTHVALNQAVTLLRDSNIGLHVDTWKAEDSGQIFKLDEVRAKVKAMIERFVAAYQAANTKKPSLGAHEPTLQLKVPQETKASKKPQ